MTMGDFTAPASPPTTPRSEGVPLFSAATRTSVAAGAMGLVRLELRDGRDPDAPAAWAVLRGRTPDGVVARGVADAQGRVALAFAYPEPRLAATANGSTHQLSWPMKLRAFYEPWPNGDVPEIPSLERLAVQAEGPLSSSLSPPTPLDELFVRFARDVAFQSGSGSSPELSRLYVTSAP